MESVRHLVVGAGVSGLAFAAASKERDLIVLEADQEIGGYCKTVHRDGFVWDYSGHFFHFKHPEIEAWLVSRMASPVRKVEKRTFISYGGGRVDFPFQKNIHQLPQAEFVECLHDLYFARAAGVSPQAPETNFKEMLYARFGRGIAERFLIPYNEKLYACDLATLDRDAMGRFFPHADLTDVIRNMRTPDNASYNATFTYPHGGAFEYVKALASEVPRDRIALDEALLRIDLTRRVATTTRREIAFERLVSSVPFTRLAAMCGVTWEAAAFGWNKVLVFNLGFDRKGESEAHWIYYPDRARSFYRVGFYDNILGSDRMSLYVELGFPRDAILGEAEVEILRKRVLEDLRAEGVVRDHVLLAHHSVVMDPAYVHVTRGSLAEVARLRRVLAAHGVYPIGRYGSWTYCSIEDNIVEARALASDFDAS